MADLDRRIARAQQLFYGLIVGAVVLVIIVCSKLSAVWWSYLISLSIGLGGIAWYAYRYWKDRSHTELKHLYVRHHRSGEWKAYWPTEQPFIPRGSSGWTVLYFDYEWKTETRQVRLFAEGEGTVTFSWRPDILHLDKWMEGDQSAMLQRLREACTELAVRRYEDAAPLSDKAGRESLVGQPIPLQYANVMRGTGLELGNLTLTVTKLHEPQPDEAGEYEELHIGNRGTVPVLLDDEDRVTHVQVIGASRFGKSKLVEHAVRQLVGKAGVIVIDPNEQLYSDLVAWGAHQGRALILLDPSDEESDIGFNPFRLPGEKTPARIAARASRLLKTALRAGKFQGGDAVLAERIMRVLFYVLVEQDLPVTALQSFMVPRLFDERDAIMRACESQDIRDEWAMLTAGKRGNAYVSMMQSSATRLVNLFMEPGVRRMLTNDMPLDIPDIVRKGVPLIANLKDTPDLVSAEARNIIGTFLVDEAWSAIKGRSKRDAEALPGLNLVIDEFHNFATPEFAMMLKEGGKYGLHMWLINHALDDLDRDVQNALNACHTRIAFGGTSKKDAAIVLEGSRPREGRELRDDVESVPGLPKRAFILRRTGKRNERCTAPEVQAFSVSAGRLRSYVETLTRVDNLLSLAGKSRAAEPPAPEPQEPSSEAYDAPTVTYHRPTDPLEIVRELRYATVAHVATITGDKSLKNQNTAKKLRALAEKGSLKKLGHEGRSVYCAPDAAEKHLEHELVITNLHVLLWDHLKLWEQGGLKGDGINPDAFFATHRHFYLEAEHSNPRSQDGESAPIKKARQYADHADARLHKPRCENFHVLFVLPTEAKARNLARAIAEAGIPNPGRFWFAWGTTDAIDADGGTWSLTAP